MADQEPDVTVNLRISRWMVDRLEVLASEDGYPDLAAVIMAVLDHVQQGVYRPGAWEREWLMQALGAGWLSRVEPDPDVPVFDRPRKL